MRDSNEQWSMKITVPTGEKRTLKIGAGERVNLHIRFGGMVLTLPTPTVTTWATWAQGKHAHCCQVIRKNIFSILK